LFKKRPRISNETTGLTNVATHTLPILQHGQCFHSPEAEFTKISKTENTYRMPRRALNRQLLVHAADARPGASTSVTPSPSKLSAATCRLQFSLAVVRGNRWKTSNLGWEDASSSRRRQAFFAKRVLDGSDRFITPLIWASRRCRQAAPN
jgi:hypothetical protein